MIEALAMLPSLPEIQTIYFFNSQKNILDPVAKIAFLPFADWLKNCKRRIRIRWMSSKITSTKPWRILLGDLRSCNFSQGNQWTAMEWWHLWNTVKLMVNQFQFWCFSNMDWRRRNSKRKKKIYSKKNHTASIPRRFVFWPFWDYTQKNQ